MKIGFDAGTRTIRVEWEGGAVTRIAVPPHLGEDGVRDIVKELPGAMRRTPPVAVERYDELRVAARCEYFSIDLPERFVRPAPLYALLDYTPYWKRVRAARAKLNYRHDRRSEEPWWFLVPVSIDPPLVRLQVTEDTVALIPEELWRAWQRLKSRYEELLKQLLAIAEQPAAAGSELEVELER